MLTLLVLVAAGIGLVGFTRQTALDRGRSGGLWSAIAAVGGFAGLVAGNTLILLTSNADPFASQSSGLLMFSTFASLIGPLLAMFLVLFVVGRLPERVPKLEGRTWPVYRMSTKDAPGFDCALSIEEGRLRIGEVVIDRKEIVESTADGEILHLRWSAGSAELMPKRGTTPKQRARQCQALAKRLSAWVAEPIERRGTA